MGLGRSLFISSGFIRSQWSTTNVSGSLWVLPYISVCWCIFAGPYRSQKVLIGLRGLDKSQWILEGCSGSGGSLQVKVSFSGSSWVSASLSGSQRDSVGLSGSWWFSAGSVISEFVVV